VLVPLIGYEAAAELAQRAQAEGSTIRQEVTRSGLLTPEQVTSSLDLLKMTQGGIRST